MIDTNEAETDDTSVTHWYVAAASAAVDRQPLAVTVAGVALVLFRRRDGTVVALADRCPHEYVPLSTGRLIGDEIECEHHGLRFDCAGRCTYMPAQSNIPSRFVVRTFPTSERDGHVHVAIPAGRPGRT